MRLTKISIKNFRSIRDASEVRVEPIQAFIGENNAGKSNMIKALQCFLTPGSGKMQITDFNQPDEPAVIECEFEGLSV